MKNTRQQKKTAKDSVATLIRIYGPVAANNSRRVSPETVEMRATTLFMVIDQLREGGYMLMDIANLKQKHLEYLARRWEAEGLSASTLQNRWSILRVVFEKWLNRKGFVKNIESYLDKPLNAKRTYISTIDRSWDDKLNSAVLIDQVMREDSYVGYQLQLMKAFGLRRKEAIMFQPNINDLGQYIAIISGTKGGRPRHLEVKGEQRTLLDEIKSQLTFKFASMGNPRLSLKQNINRFNNVMQKLGITKAGLGVTSHGLRHQFANNLLEELTQQPAPVRADPIEGSMPVDPIKYRQARESVTNALGHSRISITTAYHGKPQKPKAEKNMNTQVCVRNFRAKRVAAYKKYGNSP